MPSTTPSPTRPRGDESSTEREGGTTCPEQSPTTWRPAWAAGAPTTGRPRRSAGSRSSSSPSRSAAWPGRRSIDANKPGPGESGRMDAILDEGFKQPAGESVLIQSDSLRVERPGIRRGDRGRRRDGSRRSTPSRTCARRSTRTNAGQIAPDGHAALVEFEIRGDADDAADKIGPVLDRVDVAQQVHPEFFIGEFGDASAVDAVETAYARRPRESRPALPSDHADHPRDRVRGAGGRGDPAAPRR